MFKKFIIKFQFGLTKRLKFYRIMSRQTDESKRGVLPRLVLNSLIKVEENNNNGKPTASSKMYKYIIKKLSVGNSFGAVMQEMVPFSEASQIYASEKIGNISNGFKMAMTIAQQQKKFKKIFQEALIGPVVNLILSVIVLYIFLKELIPKMCTVLEKDSMSEFSLFMANLADSFDNWFYLLLSIILISVIWIIWALPNYNGYFRKILDNMPPFSLYKVMIGCSFLQALNSLMSSRVAQNEALKTINKFATPYLKFRINKILEQTSRSLGEALISIKLNFPHKDVLNELAMASEQGNIDESLPHIIEDLDVDGVELIKVQAQFFQVITRFITFFVLAFLMSGLLSFLKDIQSMTPGI